MAAVARAMEVEVATARAKGEEGMAAAEKAAEAKAVAGCGGDGGGGDGGGRDGGGGEGGGGEGGGDGLGGSGAVRAADRVGVRAEVRAVAVKAVVTVVRRRR